MTVGLVGLFMSVAIDLVIVFGKDQYDNVAIGSTMGLVAFSLMLVVAAFECRDETASILRMETFDNNIVNITVAGRDRPRAPDRPGRRADVAARHRRPSPAGNG